MPSGSGLGAAALLALSWFAPFAAHAQEANTASAPAVAPAPASAAADAPAPAPAPAASEDWRSRLYGRVMAGPGITDFEVRGLSDSRAVTYNFTASFGYVLHPSLVVGVEMDAAGAPDAGIWFSVNGDWKNETSLGYLALGPTVIAYAPFNSHASFSVGLSRFTLHSDLPTEDQFFEIMTDWGLTYTLILGHEFRLTNKMSLGAAAQFYYSGATGDELFFEGTQVSARGIGIVLSGSAH